MSGTLTPAQVLREAADHIESVGLVQNGNMYQPPPGVPYYPGFLTNKQLAALPCCTMGALLVVQRRHRGPYARTDSSVEIARTALYDAPEIEPVGSIAEWNDQKTTTQADVLRVLRTTADKLEEKEKNK